MRITKPTGTPPDTQGLTTTEAVKAYEASGWVWIPDAPASAPMTAEEFAKIPPEKRLQIQ